MTFYLALGVQLFPPTSPFAAPPPPDSDGGAAAAAAPRVDEEATAPTPAEDDGAKPATPRGAEVAELSIAVVRPEDEGAGVAANEDDAQQACCGI